MKKLFIFLTLLSINVVYGMELDNALDKKSAEEQLLEAAEKGDLEKVKRLCVLQDENGRRLVDINVKGKCLGTPLLWAALEGHIEVVKYLVEQCKADVNACANNNVTPLWVAVRNGHIEVVRYLSKHGANVNTHAVDNETPLWVAVRNGHIEVVKYLVEQCGADVNARAVDNAIPLHLAALEGHIEVVKYLVEQCKADVNARVVDNATPLWIAAGNGHIEVVKYLVEQCGADVNARAVGNSAPLHCAAGEDHIEVVKYLVEQCEADVNACIAGVVDCSTPLHCAAQDGHVEVVRYLVERGADVNAQTYYDVTPLICVIKKLDAANEASTNQQEVINLLLYNGANPFIKCPYPFFRNNKKNAIDIARGKGLDDVVELLSKSRDQIVDERAIILSGQVMTEDCPSLPYEIAEIIAKKSINMD